MPTTSDPLAVYTIAEQIRMCAHERLAAISAGEPARSCVIAGKIAWDDCECGQLVVAINHTYLSNDFPQPAAGNPGNKHCGPSIMVISYTVSILRCSPTGQDQSPPTCDDLAEAARVAVLDADAVRWGVWCCLKSMSRVTEVPALKIHNFQMGAQPMVGAQGVCQGSELSVLVGVINSCPPCEGT